MLETEEWKNESAVLVWPIATYGCERWTLRKNEKTRLDAFEMKGLKKLLRVSWTTNKTNEWVLNKAGVKMELLGTVKAKKLAYYGHKGTRELPEERDRPNVRNNGWTNWQLDEDSGGPTEPRIRWGSRYPKGNGQFWGLSRHSK